MSRKDILNKIIEEYCQTDINFDVYIIADIQKKTVSESDDRIIHADESEFFSKSEFAEIASAIFNVFGFVRVFYSEIEFIEYFINSKIDPQKCIVYNFSRDGKNQGKKSLIPAFCDLYNIKYTGSDAFTISLLRNKSVYTDLLYNHSIAVPKSMTYAPYEDNLIDVLNSFACQDIIIKNIWESASIGLNESCKMTINENSLDLFQNTVKKINSNSVLVQEFIDGIECEVMVLQHNGKYYALDPVEIIFPKSKEFMDSIISNNYSYKFRLINDKLSDNICSIAEKCAKILNIKDYARFDFRIKDNVPYLFDIAGTPYTIMHSSVAYVFNEYGFNYQDIYKVVVTCMLSNYKNNTHQ